MEQWTDIRRAVLVDGVSKRAACRKFGIHWDTLKRILGHPSPPGYLRKRAAEKAVITPWLGRLGEWIEANQDLPRKQRYTVKRMWRVLHGEGFAGGYTTLKDAVREMRKQAPKEVFMPLTQPPGEAQREDGTREYIRVLLLLRDYPPERVAIAVHHSLRWTAPTSDAIKQLLIPSERPELKTFHLAGREHLAGVTVAATDLGSYGRLREVAHA
jgi:transposase